MAARPAAALALAVCAALSACSPVGSRPDPTNAVVPAPTAESDSEPSGETVGETRIRTTVGNQTIEARLHDNPTARSLIDQLPLTLDFSDYGGQEVLAAPPSPLTMEGAPAGESAPAGTIGWYAPGGVIVLYYADVGRYNGIVRIGEMDGDASLLSGWSGSRSVTIELAD